MDELLFKLNALTKTPNEEAREYLRVHQVEDDRAEAGIWEQFIEDYERAIQSISTHWGPPAFEGTWETDGFPEWHPWVARLAYWQRDGRQVYIECNQQDSELPITLAIGVRATTP